MTRKANPLRNSTDKATAKQTSPKPADLNGEGEQAVGQSLNGAPAPTDPTVEIKTADPFDPASLRVGSDFAFGLKKAVFTVSARKPDKAWWIRAHPDAAYRLQTAVIERRGERGGAETHLVAPHLRDHLATEPTFRPMLLVTAINTQDVVFIWEINLPRDDRENKWAQTALAAVEVATKGWTRIAANMSAGHYDVWQASGNLAEPQWPQLTFREILKLAYKDRYIDDLNHPVLRQLRGEV
jgi:hypothetical protein